MVDLLQALPRPDAPGLRWTHPNQWHITLRFLGEVDHPDTVLGPLRRAFTGVPIPEAIVGPAVERLGRGVLVVPVAGLASIADAAVAATRDIGEPPPSRPFTGHLTVARLKRRSVRCPTVGEPIRARWTVTEAELIRSHISSDGARYESLAFLPINSTGSRRSATT